MASAGVREIDLLIKIILTTDGTNVYMKGDTWCKREVSTPLVNHT